MMSVRNCNEFDEALMDSVASRNGDGPALREHAESCARCSGILAEDRTLNAAIGVWNQAVPSTDLCEPILARWRAEHALTVPNQPATPKPPRRERTAPRARVLLGTVAVALVVASVALLTRHTFEPDSRPPSARPDSIAGKAQPPPALPSNGNPAANNNQPTEVADFVNGVRSGYSNMTRNVTQTMAALRLPPLDTQSIWPDFESKPAVDPPPKTPAKTDWGTGLKPVERDVRKAFGFLRDAVPILSSPST